MQLYFKSRSPKLGSRQRSYLNKSTGTHQNTEVKNWRARIVLGWVTAWELRVTLAFYSYFFSPPTFLALLQRPNTAVTSLEQTENHRKLTWIISHTSPLSSKFERCTSKTAKWLKITDIWLTNIANWLKIAETDRMASFEIITTM